MLSYLNKKKAENGQVPDIPVGRITGSNGFHNQSPAPSNGKEEYKTSDQIYK
jgi:hypothetical protein